MTIREDAQKIIDSALLAAQPDTAVAKALKKLPAYTGKLVLVAMGKAGWQMAKAAYDQLGDKIDDGVVVTKYGHSMGPIGNLQIFEASHPVPDENGYKATQKAIDAVKDLGEEDLVIFLISGGGSALFEKPAIPENELEDVTKQLLACGADIVEINTLRKRFSLVKGGKFAEICAPARVFSIVLSDIIGDPLDMIASGPAYPDKATSAQAVQIAAKYSLNISEQAADLLGKELPRELPNTESHITGSVKQLCLAAEQTARELGYEPVILSASLCCEARDAGSFMASIAKYYEETDKSLAFIAGGETVVHLTGTGLGGRNQEMALSAAQGLSGMKDVLFFSVGSDGTDGPTDAAGGIVDGTTAEKMAEQGFSIPAVLSDNDAYHALQAADGLVMTGPTGTNVNDLSVLLIKR